MSPFSVLIYNAKVWKWRECVKKYFCPQANSSNAKKENVYNDEDLRQILNEQFLIIRNGFIEQVGKQSELIEKYSADAGSSSIDSIQSIWESQFDTIVNANGRLILPGLIDSHIHVGKVGETQYYVDLQDCNSIDQLKDRLQNHALKYREKLSWLIGINWDQTNLGRYPTRFDLDDIPGTENIPIFLWRACWHIGVGNTTAMNRAKIISTDGSSSIQSPPGGVIEVDESGTPTGIVKEVATQLIVSAQEHDGEGAKVIERKAQMISEGLSICAKYGLTCVQTVDDYSVEAYHSLQVKDCLPIRVFHTPLQEEIYSSKCSSKVKVFRPKCLTSRPDYADSDASSPDSMLLTDRIKIFCDGSLGAETAALRNVLTSSNEGLPNQVAGKGVLVHEKQRLVQMMIDSYNSGLRLEIHAIGDAAAEQVLDALDESEVRLREIHGFAVRHRRPILTHCQVLGPDLIERMTRRGMIANIQPSFVPTDMKWVKSRLLEPQYSWSYVWKQLLLYGANVVYPSSDMNELASLTVAGGSDAPIESPNPFIGIYDAMFRSDKHRRKASDSVGDHDQFEIFKAEERLSFAEALWIYTVGGAYTGDSEQVLGQIEAGFVADLLLIDSDLAVSPEIAEKRLYGMMPDIVMVGGKFAAVNNAYHATMTERNKTCVTEAIKLIEYENNNPAEAIHDEFAYMRLRKDKPFIEKSSKISWRLAGYGGMLGVSMDSPNYDHSADPREVPDLSNAVFLPGKNGPGLQPITSFRPGNDLGDYCLPSLPGSPRSGPMCSCILQGKYCNFGLRLNLNDQM